MKSTGWPLVLFFMLLVAQAFAVNTPYTPGTPWWEIRSPHFSVVTNADEKQGREVARHLEEIRAVFGALAEKGNISAPVPLQIIAFRSRDDVRRFAPLWNEEPDDVPGLFQPDNDHDFIIIDLSVADPWPVVFHEYAHYLLKGNYPQTQPWFDEGFAEYYSTLTIVNNIAEIGRPPKNARQFLKTEKLMSIPDLFSVERESEIYRVKGKRRLLFYLESWLVVKYLYDKKQISHVIKYYELVDDQQKSVPEAIQSAFGMDVSTFDKELRQYRNVKNGSVYRLPVPALPDLATYTSIQLQNADAQAVLADAHVHSADYGAQGVQEFEQILRDHPDNLAAQRGLGHAYLNAGDYQRALVHFKRAAELNSKDPLVHYYSALLMNEMALSREEHRQLSAQMKKELEAAITEDPDFADAYNLLADACFYAGEYDAAIDNMKRAIALSPRNEPYALSLAHYYAAARKWDDAVAVLAKLKNSPNSRVSANAVQQLSSVERSRKETERSESLESLDSKQFAVGIGAIKYLKGTLLHVDCSTMPAVVLSVESDGKVWRLVSADASKLLLIGADAFSCSWSNQQVLVNYRQTGEAEGFAVSLEVQ